MSITKVVLGILTSELIPTIHHHQPLPSFLAVSLLPVVLNELVRTSQFSPLSLVEEY